MSAHLLTISTANARAVTGMSPVWCFRFAAEHGVPIYRVGKRKRLIDAQALLAAIAAKNVEREDGADELAAMRRRVQMAGAR